MNNLFPAWTPLKVINQESTHAGRAGVFLRSEGSGGVVVRLDEGDGKPQEVVTFDAAEVQSLA